VLPVDPVLVRGQQILVRASGFAGGADVAIRLANTSQTRHAPADANGVLVLRYAVGLQAAYGTDVLTFEGAPAVSATPIPQEHDALPLRDDSPFVFLVPRVWLFHFRVDRTTGNQRRPPTSGGGIAYTGADVAALLALGVVVIAIGVLILRTARRPRSDQAP
jgi:hypothetical protein